MNILWFSWKDSGHPQAGGAEVVSSEIRRRMIKNGHSVTLITSGYPGSGEYRDDDRVQTYYVGTRHTVYIKAFLLYKRKLRGWDDVTIDEMNTLPFLSAIYTTAQQKVLLAYQLARNVWFYQMIFPLSIVGYLFEPLLLLFTSRLYGTSVTESQSSAKDMARYGFRGTKVFMVGMELRPLSKLESKTDSTLVLSLGAVRPMKRTLHAVKAFEYARDTRNDLRMVIAGDIDSSYGKRVQRYATASRHADSIRILGRVPKDEKLNLMKQAGIILVTSIKEGWGLIVTEANSQGTPAIVYDTDGLRDSVRNGSTGITVRNGDPHAMASELVDLLGDPKRYAAIRMAAWRWSKEFSFDASYDDFMRSIGVPRR